MEAIIYAQSEQYSIILIASSLVVFSYASIISWIASSDGSNHFPQSLHLFIFYSSILFFCPFLQQLKKNHFHGFAFINRFFLGRFPKIIRDVFEDVVHFSFLSYFCSLRVQSTQNGWAGLSRIDIPASRSILIPSGPYPMEQFIPGLSRYVRPQREQVNVSPLSSQFLLQPGSILETLIFIFLSSPVWPIGQPIDLVPVVEPNCLITNYKGFSLNYKKSSINPWDTSNEASIRPNLNFFSFQVSRILLPFFCLVVSHFVLLSHIVLTISIAKIMPIIRKIIANDFNKIGYCKIHISKQYVNFFDIYLR